MQIGITATRDGLSERQKFYTRRWLESLMIQYENIIIEHGDCIGGDSDLHTIAENLGLKISLRPCNIPALRAFREGAFRVYAVQPPLIRNKHIVDQSSHLLVLPNSKEELQRSGTWSTKRYANKRRKPYTIIYPDGDISSKVSYEN